MTGTADARVREGDTGFFFRDAVECFAADAKPNGLSTEFIDPGGSDSNQGDSPDTAKASLAAALCNAQPGQTIKILPGTYRQSVIVSGIGGADMPI